MSLDDDLLDDDSGIFEEEYVSTGYEPRPLQAQIHTRLTRFSVLACHRRFGKTVLALNHGLSVGLQVKLPNPKIGFISPLYKQSKTVAWDYLKNYTRMIPGSKAYESELKVVIDLGNNNKLTYQLYGSDSPDSLRGNYYDYMIFDEFGNQPASIWFDIISPALADRHGGSLFLGTPCGKNHFYSLFMEAMKKMNSGDPEWFAATYRADETGVIDEKELAQQRDNLDETSYRTEFLCDFAAAVRGSYYADYMTRARDEERICRVPHEQRLPVFAAFDLGIDDMTAVWFFQVHRSEIRLIDYNEWINNEGLIDVLKDMQNLPYVYARLILPWDAEIREQTTGKTRTEFVEDMGFEVEVCPKLSVEDGINAVRTILSQCWFDRSKCELGIERLENYRKKYDQRKGEFLRTPEHDINSHGCDAFRYLAVAHHEGMGDGYSARGGPLNKAKQKVIRSC